MTNQATALPNGVNVEALLGAREALTEMPAAAKFIWRAESEWKSGTHAESRIEGFFGLGEEHVDVYMTSVKNSATCVSSVSTRITRRFSPPKTTARRRSNTFSSAWPGA